MKHWSSTTNNHLRPPENHQWLNFRTECYRPVFQSKQLQSHWWCTLLQCDLIKQV
jgi:hypothetical protein